VKAYTLVNVPVRPDDPRPAYLQLASELRDAIEAGRYHPGDRLPSVRQLADAQGIAPMTVQHALKVLRDEGLVVSQPGRGLFVQESKEAADDQSAPTPKTLDEALEMIADLNARLSRLETQAPPPEPDPGPTPDQATGPEL
jgi:DNA-binding transcriptional regulator YhcF (GntR family)